VRYHRAMPKQIVAMGGGGFMMEPENPLLDDFVLGAARGAQSRVCLLPTASGDADRVIVQFYTVLGPRCVATHLPLFNRRHADPAAFLLEQDVVYVTGGNTANMLAVWRVHGIDVALRRAYEAGVVLCGLSAGALCWFESGTTDSFSGLAPFRDGLGFLPGSISPHYDGEARRRPLYQRFVADGGEPGFGIDDGAAMHFVDGALREVVSSRPQARAYRVARGQDLEELALPTRFLGA
jgi:dipeptidase E